MGFRQGGIQGLIHFLSDNETAALLEADFQEYYNIDIRDVWRKGSGLTHRRAGSLLRNLPAQSRFVKHIQDNDGWDREMYIEADKIDLLRLQLYWINVFASKGLSENDYKATLKKQPKPLKRPGDAPMRFNSVQDLARLTTRR